ncbi:binding partner of ACD11 1-like isoform X2 [Magnolia sinica]|uniref:binding partner of ACD11 1-like isoform X2 n=1 Tax=Magnolia sinica TaxID=86752 RepID=UPI00265B0350|nr:binding partner of ACD11 1-like isoform X2 [Magnolia sinica]
MSAPMDHCSPKTGMDTQSAVTPNWTIDVSDIRTVKVSNISLAATKQDIKEFFSFAGDIIYIEMRGESESSQLAYVTFKDPQGADTATLLSGAVIINLSVNITRVEGYQLPPLAFSPPSGTLSGGDSVVKKAEDVVSSMLAKGFVLGKDALSKAKALDERHHLISTASATVTSLDQKMGLREKLSMGTAVVHEKAREVDERFQVYEKTRSALTVASSAGSALMSNHYVSVGASWLSSALTAVTKAAEDVSLLTKEKVERAEEEKNESIYRERTAIVSNFAQIHLEDELVEAGELPMVPINSATEEGKLEII